LSYKGSKVCQFLDAGLSVGQKETFENSISKLEEIVKELESKDMDLDASLIHFEKGVDLYRKCRMHLEKVEKKIAKLSENLEEEALDSPN